MEEGRKRVLGIIAGLLVACHLNNTEDLQDRRPSPPNRVADRVRCAMGRSDDDKN